jgi:hypothetical protein
MPDGWEVDHGLDPRVPDADGDLDEDASTNLDEFLDDSHPGDPNSPKRTVWVGPNGTDSVTSGTFARPYATIAFALSEVFNPDLNPTRIVVFAGSYVGDLVLVPNVTLTGALGHTVEILGTIQGAGNCELVNLSVLGDTGDEVLLDMADVAMTVRGVLFEGSEARPGVGILATGGAPAASIIEGCAFLSLISGIEIQGATPLIRDSQFAEMSVAGVVYQSGADVGTRNNGKFGDSATGWNVFDLASLDGPAVINLNSATAVMEINDWTSDSGDEIAARVQGPVDFVPFLGAGSGGLAATVYVTVWDAETQVRIEDASVTLLGEEIDTVQDNRNGVYTFALVPGKEYLVEVKARRYQTQTIRFEVDAGQRRSLVVPLVPRKGGVIGCHADGAGAGSAAGMVLPALLTGLFLLAHARGRRRADT